MDVIQCPECELRFRSTSELEQHIASDHPEFHVEWQRGRGLSDAHRHRRDRTHGEDRPH